MSNKKLLKGAFILAFAGLLAKFFGVFFKIPLQRLIGDEGMGLFGLPYPLYVVMLSISITGFPAAISKLISERLAYRDVEGANKIFIVSLLMLICIGLFSTSFLYFGAPYIIELLNWPRDAYFSIIGLSLAPLFVSIMSAFRGYFQGMQLMVPTAISQIVEQMGRVIIGVGLAYYSYSRGIGYAAGAASFGASAGGILGFIVLFIYYIKFRRGLGKRSLLYRGQEGPTDNSSLSIIKRLVWFALPISIGGILGSVMTLIDAIMVPSRLLQSGYTIGGLTSLYGQLTGKAVTLMNVPLTFSVAMATSLIPAIAESYSRGDMEELGQKTGTAIKITIIIALPATLGLFILAPQIIHLLWGQGERGGNILRILALNVIFISLAQILASILQGINKVFIPLRNLFLAIIIKIIISYYLLATSLNILGAVIGSIAGYFIVMVLNYIGVRRSITFSLGIKNSIIKPLLGSLAMLISVGLVYPTIYIRFSRENLATLLSILVAILVYFIFIYFSGAIHIDRTRFRGKYRKM